MPMRDGEWVWGAWGRVGGQTVRQGTVRGRSGGTGLGQGRGGAPPRPGARGAGTCNVNMRVMNRCLAVAKWDLRAAIYAPQ
jgi:hypothetical protein